MQKATIFQSLCAILVRWWFAKADIIINGTRPFDIRVNNPAFYQMVCLGRSLGFGEAYQAGYWDCDALPECVSRAKRGMEAGFIRILELPFRLGRKLLKLQTRERAKVAVADIYDLSNTLYRAMLGPTKKYTCGYTGRGATTLDGMQWDCMWLLAEKLRLAPGMKVLEVGCGWGGFAFFLAEEYDVHVIGITLSREQLEYALLNYSNPRRGSVEFQLQDYRDVHETFHRIVSVGMFEHVGPPFYALFAERMYRLLKTGGIFVLHTIVGHGRADRWINKYIFPYGVLPALSQIEAAFAKLFFEWDRHEFGADYAPTLRFWRENLMAAWPQFEGKSYSRGIYDERCRRTWEFFLAGSEGYFAGAHGWVHEFVYSKHVKPPAYVPVR